MEKNALQQAYMAQWIDDESIWLDMLKDRNLTSHTYREEQANMIYAKIPRYAQLMRKLHTFVQASS